MTAPERPNGHYQGIDACDNRNTTKIRVGAGNGLLGVAADRGIPDVLGYRFFIPLDFELLESHMQLYQGVLVYLIDDCSASNVLTKKNDMSMLAFSGPHAEQSVWVLTQKYNSVLKDLREQARWVYLFHCKDRDSFEDCLRENDVIPSLEQRVLVRKQLAETKHFKLRMKTDQPVGYTVLSDV